MSPAAAVGCLFVAAPACSGAIGDPYDTDDSVPRGEDAPIEQLAARLRFPRLSHSQWENTVVDLLRLDAPLGLSDSFTPDPLGGKAFDNNESALQITPGLWADYQRAAEEVALRVSADPSLLARVLPPDLPADPESRESAFIESFGRRALRRPLTAEETARLESLFDDATSLDPSADPFVAGVRLSIEALLQSPHFLYRPELGKGRLPDGRTALSGYEIATRLSYALWGTMPDDALFAAAAEGELDSPAGVESHARRLLAGERARRTIIAFHDQLYDAEQYLTIDKSLIAYPDFDPAIGEDMRRELSLFIEHTLFTQRGTLADLFTSRVTFVNARLAAVYGLPSGGLDNDTFVKVELPEAERAGLLTRAGFLAWKGTPSQPDTILRGVFVNRRILCQELGDPPPAAMGAKLGNETTDREKVTALTGKGTCGETCHGTFINPIGFAFEHYGAMGEYRTKDNGKPVNAADTFPFQGGARSYDGAVELSRIAAEQEQTHRCYARYWLEYLHGRDREKGDTSLIDSVARLSADGATVEDIVIALVTSDAFLTRSSEEASQ